MTAKEAREKTEAKLDQLKSIENALKYIEQAIENGNLRCEIPIKLNQSTIEVLEQSGYRIREVEDFRNGLYLPPIESTIISW